MTDFTFRKLSLSDAEILEEFFRQSSDFSLLTSGISDPKAESSALLTELPEGKTAEDKAVLGAFDENEQLVALVDIVQNFPTAGEWILGLLEILPECRHQGLGQHIHAELIKKIQAKGARSLRIGVFQDNPDALSFWQKLGYQKIDEKSLTFGNKSHKVDVMRIYL